MSLTYWGIELFDDANCQTGREVVIDVDNSPYVWLNDGWSRDLGDSSTTFNSGNKQSARFSFMTIGNIDNVYINDSGPQY